MEYTLGSRRVQHYLTTIEKGRIVVLPPSWDVQRRQWFDNMDIVRPGRTAGPPIQQWNKDCVGCHVSGEDKHFNPETLVPTGAISAPPASAAMDPAASTSRPTHGALRPGLWANA